MSYKQELEPKNSGKNPVKYYVPKYPPPPEYFPPKNGYESPPSQPSVPPPNYYYQVRSQLAGFFPRLLAIAIDGVLIGIPTGILTGILALTWSRMFFGLGNAPSLGASIVMWALYAWFCYTYLAGNTVGKKIMSIKLVTADGNKPSLQTYLLHYSIGYAVNGLVLCLGFLWALFDADNQTWGQKLFNTYTVSGNW